MYLNLGFLATNTCATFNREYKVNNAGGIDSLPIKSISSGPGVTI